MKQKNFRNSNKQKTGSHFIRTWFFCLCFLGTFTSLQAQYVAWKNNLPPSMTPNPLIVLSDTTSIDIDFSILGGTADNVRVEIQLPPNLSYYNTEIAAGHTAGAITTPTTAGTEATGITVAVGFANTSLSQGTAIHLKVRVFSKTCTPIASGTLTIKALSGTAPITSGEATVNIDTQKPVFRLQDVSPTNTPTTPETDKASFAFDIDVTNGSARSLKMTLSGDQYTFIENFKLDGKDISASVTSSGTTTKTWTITLTGEVFDAVARKLTFDAWSDRIGSRNITTAFQYPATSACVSGSIAPLVLAYPPVVGSVNLVLNAYTCYSAINGGTALSWFGSVPMDGATPCYFKVGYKNTGEATARDISATFIICRNSLQYGYIDTTNVRYSINGGELKKPASITVVARLADDNMRKLKPGISGKPLRISISTDPADRLQKDDVIAFWYPLIQGAIYDNTDYISNTNTTETLRTLQWALYTVSAKDLSGKAGNVPTGGSTYANMTSMEPPVFRAVPTSFNIRPDVRGEVAIPLALGTLSSSQSLEIFVQLPAWMEPDGNLTDALKVGSLTPSATSSNGKTYSIRVSTGLYDSSDTLHLKYKTISSHSYTENQKDTIRYRMDWHLYNPDGKRPDLQRFGQLFQPVTFLVEEDGLKMEAFTFRRTTKGLKDSNNNGIPDDGSIAPDNEIEHYKYRSYDRGEMTITGEIVGNNTGRNYFYLLISSPVASLNGSISLGNAALSITGTSPAAYSDLSFNADGNYRRYLKVNTTTPLTAGDRFTVTVPFSIGNYGTVAGDSYSLQAEAYVSDQNISDAFNPPDGKRFGYDLFGKAISIVSVQWNDKSTTASFNETCTPLPADKMIYSPGNFNYNFRVASIRATRWEVVPGFRSTATAVPHPKTTGKPFCT